MRVFRVPFSNHTAISILHVFGQILARPFLACVRVHVFLHAYSVFLWHGNKVRVQLNHFRGQLIQQFVHNLVIAFLLRLKRIRLKQVIVWFASTRHNNRAKPAAIANAQRILVRTKLQRSDESSIKRLLQVQIFVTLQQFSFTLASARRKILFQIPNHCRLARRKRQQSFLRKIQTRNHRIRFILVQRLIRASQVPDFEITAIVGGRHLIAVVIDG
mmetsp:Transcript_6324/g.10031  ORF Transcript_6324/g.10031 Transcript_6324/m.10031 type:complete len:216 (+) Transcript_6324:340-987(+)